jgi:hypothetical protein
MVSTWPSESFNPTFCVRLHCVGDYHDYTLQQAIDQLLIYDNILIKKSNLNKIINKYGRPFDEPKEANLRNLLNQDLIKDAPREWYDYYTNRDWKH